MKQNNKRMAVKVAEDVLLWMRKKSFVVDTGAYIWLEGENDPDLAGQSLKALLPKLITTKTPCIVCALGACFIAHVARKNQFELDGKGIVRNNITDRLASVFTYDQMVLIEDAFERDDNPKLAKFRMEESDRKRLRMIMRNIIENKGVFVP